jgi:hypothetical protein
LLDETLDILDLLFEIPSQKDVKEAILIFQLLTFGDISHYNCEAYYLVLLLQHARIGLPKP